MTTTQQKTGWTLAGVLVVLASIGTGWGHIEPALSWIVKELGAVFGREQVQAVCAACAIGVLTGVFLPRWMPAEWSPAKTRTVTGLICGGIAFGAALTLVPTRIGIVYAVLAAVATPTLSEAIAGIWYWRKPCAKPESLQP